MKNVLILINISILFIFPNPTISQANTITIRKKNLQFSSLDTSIYFAGKNKGTIKLTHANRANFLACPNKNFKVVRFNLTLSTNGKIASISTIGNRLSTSMKKIIANMGNGGYITFGGIILENKNGEKHMASGFSLKVVQ